MRSEQRPFVAKAFAVAAPEAVLRVRVPDSTFQPRHVLHPQVETRTSAPVRIVRDEDTLESTRVRGLYPSGEGAGYAGGIVSAAVDGLRVAGALLRARGVAAGAPDVARVQDMY